MTRLTILVVLGGAGLLFTPAAASAQFVGFGLPHRPGFGGFGAPTIVPSMNPFFYVPRYYATSGISIPTMYGGNLTFRSAYGGIYPPYAYNMPYQFYGQSGSYMTGSPNTRNDYVLAAQRNMAKAQRDATANATRTEISGLGNYEKGLPPPDLGPTLAEEAFRAPLAPADLTKVSSGEALNVLLKQIIALEAKGAKGPAPYIPPMLMDDMRFGGTPAGDLLDLVRQAGTLKLPEALEDVALALPRAALEKDFATAAASVLDGKSPEPAKIAKLEITFQQFQDAAAPIIKELPFEDATAARRFINRMTNAIRGMKNGAANGLYDPRWSSEGLTVADLTKQMAKYKLLFRRAPGGSEEAYTTMHQNLANYLFVLSQAKK